MSYNGYVAKKSAQKDVGLAKAKVNTNECHWTFAMSNGFEICRLGF